MKLLVLHAERINNIQKEKKNVIFVSYQFCFNIKRRFNVTSILFSELNTVFFMY